MTKLQKVGYGIVGGLFGASQTFAADGKSIFGLNNVNNSSVQGMGGSAENNVQTLITNFMLFLGLLAVVLAIYGGFMILTAAGDDGKVKKGKTVLMQAFMGLVVIFLAYSIVNWFLGLILK